MVEKVIGFEATLWCGADANAATATIQLGGVFNIGFPEISRDAVEVTDADSAGRYREFIPGLIDAGELTADMHFDPNHVTETEIIEMMTETKSRYWEVKFPQYATGRKATFRGFLTGKKPGPELDGKITQSITIKLTGAITWANLP